MGNFRVSKVSFLQDSNLSQGRLIRLDKSFEGTAPREVGVLFLYRQVAVLQSLFESSISRRWLVVVAVTEAGSIQSFQMHSKPSDTV